MQFTQRQFTFTTQQFLWYSHVSSCVNSNIPGQPVNSEKLRTISLLLLKEQYQYLAGNKAASLAEAVTVVTRCDIITVSWDSK